MSGGILKTIVRLTDMVETTIGRVSKNLDFENTLSNRNIHEILDNPEDKSKLDAAIEHLKQHRDEKFTEITLSDKAKLTISIS